MNIANYVTNKYKEDYNNVNVLNTSGQPDFVLLIVVQMMYTLQNTRLSSDKLLETKASKSVQPVAIRFLCEFCVHTKM